MALRSLAAPSNLLHTLPPSFGSLTSLEELDISQNRFVELPASLLALEDKLHCILFEGNSFSAEEMRQVQNALSSSKIQTTARLRTKLAYEFLAKSEKSRQRRDARLSKGEDAKERRASEKERARQERRLHRQADQQRHAKEIEEAQAARERLEQEKTAARQQKAESAKIRTESQAMQPSLSQGGQELPVQSTPSAESIAQHRMQALHNQASMSGNGLLRRK